MSVATAIHHPTVVKVGVYILGFGMGVATATFFSRRRYETMVADEVEKARDYYRVLYKKDEMDKPPPPEGQESQPAEELEDEERLDEYETIIEDEEYSRPENPEDDRIPEEKLAEASWFPRSDFDVDHAADRAPYLVPEAVFLENEPNHVQVEWTWYEKDGIVVDETNNQVHNYHEVIGDLDLTHFDDMSADGVQVFVRNDVSQIDALILIDYESWNTHNLGVDEEKAISHMQKRDRRKVRKFRSDDG